MALITLTTDFGSADPYVGVMKGVILGIAPGARLVDLTHDLPPRHILAAALTLEAAVPHMPDGTIHLAVVDPGVGSTRRAVAVKTDRALFVAPDNGLLSLVLRHDAPRGEIHAVELTNSAYHRRPVSATFHGRDIFAPVAAHLAAGAALEELGPCLAPEALVRLELPQPTRGSDGSLTCHVLHADRFGNLVTSLRREVFERLMPAASSAAVRLRIADREIIGLSRTFADVPEEELVAYFGSSDRLEIAVRDGSAAESCNIAWNRSTAPQSGADCVAVRLCACG